MDIETKKSIQANYLSNKEFTDFLKISKNKFFGKYQLLSITIIILFYYPLKNMFHISQLNYLIFIAVISTFFHFVFKYNIFLLSRAYKISEFNNDEFKKMSFKNKLNIGFLLNFNSAWFLFVFAALIKLFLYENYIIPSESMYPTLKVGDITYAKKFNINEIKKGDIIVFKSVLTKGDFYSKRIIASPGDEIIINNNDIIVNKVKIKDKEPSSIITISLLSQVNNEYIDIKHLLFKENDYNVIEIDKTNINFIENFPLKNDDFPLKNKFNGIENCSFVGINQLTCKLPNNKYFVLGDNRDNSIDSRYFGFIDYNDIVGKVEYKNLMKKI